MMALREALAKEQIDYGLLAVGVLSVTYNCLLAFINHNITPLASSHVVLSEILLLVYSFGFILKRGLYEEDLAPLGYLLATIFLTIYVMVTNRAGYIDHLRNVLIIFAFVIMGRWTNERTLKLIFKTCCIVVLAVLICEIVSVQAYVALFHPAEYFENTRGVPRATYSDIGLFRGALGFPSRFSFGIIDHRSSSIFLEQVSLANFCGVLVIYLVSFSNRLRLFDRLLFLFTVVLILVTNDTRTMLIFSVVCLGGYFVYPWIPKICDFLMMPAIITMGFVIHAFRPDAHEDDFVGRISGTVRNIFAMDIPATLGLELEKATTFVDSGYVYITYGATIFGLILFWLFVSFFPAGETPNQKRLAHSLSLFMFLNLMIGSTAIFSMKTAGLVWLLVGFLKVNEGVRGKRAVGKVGTPISA
ncbi:putative polymerase [Rhizobium sullae]|uniref:Putative polymerase n=2 Tax=Rhizobium sullae TaxID=50338 RepID=A0A4R3QJ88_RHISU|nr:putative polymerase [Rhizobium sullae]